MTIDWRSGLLIIECVEAIKHSQSKANTAKPRLLHNNVMQQQWKHVCWKLKRKISLTAFSLSFWGNRDHCSDFDRPENRWHFSARGTKLNFPSWCFDPKSLKGRGRETLCYRDVLRGSIPHANRSVAAVRRRMELFLGLGTIDLTAASPQLTCYKKPSD